MKIVWVCNSTEAETDLWRAAQNHADLDIETWCVSAVEGKIELPYFQHGVLRPGPEGRRELLERVAAVGADLFVFRYPTWLTADGLEGTFRRLFADRPVIGWVSEQGPTKEWALATMKHFAWVAVNARVELPFYRAALPGVKLSYLPFGCAWRTDEELTSRPQYLADFVADGSCHYLCGEYGGWKKPSVDVMVRPLLDQDIALWGHAPDRCGWKGVPGAAGKYRGAYAPVEHAQVYTSSKVYLGISWNWSLGGYGIKLARALGAGICTMWHRTVGMELDGIIPGVHLVAPGTAEETRAEGLRLLGDSEARQTIAAAGRAFALAHWEWGANLKRLIDDVHHGREERP